MDREFKTTFIPKKKLTENREKEGVTRTKSSGLLSLLAGLLFITALVSVAGVYLYKMNKISEYESNMKSIKSAEKSFEPGLILSLKKLDIRLNAATELLSKHIALSDFFQSLGETTLPSIAFNDFSFSYDGLENEVKISGESKGYLPIAQQSDLFESNKYIKNHIFSDFSLTDTGNVAFTLSFTLDPELILYGWKIKNIQVDTDIKDGVVIHNEDNTLPGGENVNFNNNNIILNQ
jgi:hypothetical protein